MNAKLSKAGGVLWDYFLMTLGGLFFCIAWSCFMIPNGITSGGVTGISTVLQFATGFPVSYSYMILNAILLVIAFIILGNGFGVRTVYCIAITTVFFRILPSADFLLCLPDHPLYIQERILVPVLGGLLEAVGIFLIFNRGGSTGGTDIVALVLGKFWPVSPGKVFIVADLFIISSVVLVPGKTLQDMVYGYLAMFSFSLFLDYLLLGNKATLQILVFSTKYEQIADYITKVMDRGVTALHAEGWFTHKDKKILLIIVRKSQMSELTRTIKKIDPLAFVSVTSASGVYGEGFEEMKVGPERKKVQNQSDVK